MRECLGRSYGAFCDYMWPPAPVAAMPPVAAMLPPVPIPPPAVLPPVGPPVLLGVPLAGVGLRRRGRPLAQVEADRRAADTEAAAYVWRHASPREQALMLGRGRGY